MLTDATRTLNATLSRKAAKEARRAQLIEATIRVMARAGYARTTLADVAAEAGISHGLVNFHFASKDNLLEETLIAMAQEYHDHWTGAVAAAGAAAAARLDAMIRADFDDGVCAPHKLAAWGAYWGEAQSRPTYQDRCGSNDAAYAATMTALCAALNAEGRYIGDPEMKARVLRVAMDGIWLDLTTMTAPYSASEGLMTAHFCAAALFPDHFGPRGLIPR